MKYFVRVVSVLILLVYTLEGMIFGTIFVNAFMEFWSLLNLLSSNQCIRDGF